MSLPRGYFSKILSMDCETTGLNFNDVNPAKGFQSISWGLIAADADTLKPIDKLYLEIKWNGTSKWNKEAEDVHGLSKDYLEKNGMSEEEAAIAIANFVFKHWNPNSELSHERNVRCCGHNVATFDIWFMRELLEKYGVMFKTGNRFIDTSSIGFAVFGAYSSDELFELVGLPVRDSKKHNALTDAEYALESLRRVRLLADTALGA